MAGRHPDSRVSVPLSFQQWADALLLHWRVDPAAVQALLPAGLTVDTYDGAAWVSLTPFRMRHARAPWAPSLPWLSHYPETNVRTYVRGPDGRDGLWFLSLDVARLPVVAGMRATIGLPYAWSAMSIRPADDRIVYRCRRRWPAPAAASHVAAHVGPLIGDPERTALDDWVTGRWRAFSRVAGRWLVVEVEHEPWPLRHAELLALDDGLLPAAGVPVARPPDLVHAADVVHARLSAPGPPRRRVRRPTIAR